MDEADIKLIEWAGLLIGAQALSEVKTADRLYGAYNDRAFVSRDLDAGRAKMAKAERLKEIAARLRAANTED